MPAPPVGSSTILPPSAVTLSVAGAFAPTSEVRTANDLAVLKHNVLELFATNTNTGVLTKYSSVTLHAPPISMLAFRPPGRDRDVIALLVTHIHLSIVAYNEITDGIDTIAAVLLSGDLLSGITSSPLVRFDKNRNLLTVFFYQKYLALIPVLGGSQNRNADEKGAVTKTSTIAASSDTAWGDEGDDQDESVKGNSETTTISVSATVGELHSKMLQLGEPVLVDFLSQLHRPLRQVRDVHFVESFTEPTIAVLCESRSTWAGRVKRIDYERRLELVEALTCSVVFLSLSLSQTAGSGASKVSAVEVGNIDGIPYNATHMMPIPPFQHVPGSIVVFAQNTLIHVTSKRRFGCYMNKIGFEEVKSDVSSTTLWQKLQWAVSPQSNATAASALAQQQRNIIFSGAAAAMIAQDALLVCTNAPDGGCLVIVTLETNHLEGKSIFGMRAELIGTGRRCSTLAQLALDTNAPLVFIGSPNGDSVMGRLIAPTGAVGIRALQPTDIMLAIGQIEDADLVDATTPDDVLALQQAKDVLQHQPAEAGAEVDSQNPYSQLLRLAASSFVDEKAVVSLTPREARDVRELLVCSGEGRSGMLTLVRRTIRCAKENRQALDTVSAACIPFASAVKRDVAGQKGHKRERDEPMSSHDLLLFSVTARTIVMKVASGQITGTDARLKVDARTIFATVALQAEIGVQVTERDVVIISRDYRLVASLRLDRNVQFAMLVSDAYLYILFVDGAVMAVDLTNVRQSRQLSLSAVSSEVTAMTYWPQEGLLLFATTVPANAACGVQTLLIARHRDGVSSPLEVVHQIENFNTLPSFVSADVALAPPKPPTKVQPDVPPVIEEMAIATLHSQRSPDPHASLFILTSQGEVSVYKLAPAVPAARLPLRFILKSREFVDKEPRLTLDPNATIEEKKRKTIERVAQQAKTTAALKRSTIRLHPFEQIAGLGGVFVAGRSPRWFFSSGNNFIVSHPHQLSGQSSVGSSSTVRSFAPLSIPFLQDGRMSFFHFLCCCEGVVSFGALPEGYDFTTFAAVTRRIPIGVTPRRVDFCASLHSCFVVSSAPVPFRPVKAPFDTEFARKPDGSWAAASQPVHLHAIQSKDDLAIPMNDRYRVDLVSLAPARRKEAGTSSVVASYELEENEQVMCSAVVTIVGRPIEVSSSELMTEEESYYDNNPPETFITDGNPVATFALGTAFPLGEDTPSRGRLLLLSSKVERGQRVVTVLHKENTKGPVTALCGVMGRYLCAAVGGMIKVFDYNWKDEKLVVNAFNYSSGLYVSSLSSVKNFVIYGDLHQSCTFARFNPEMHTLDLLGRHAAPFSIVAAEALYRDGSLGIVASDANRQLLLLGYQPRIRSTDGKVVESRLTLESEMRLPGGSASTLLRMRTAAPDGSKWLSQSKLVYTTNYGEIGLLWTLSEQDNRTVQWILRKLLAEVPHAAGLTPKYFKGLDQSDPVKSLAAKTRMIDGDLLKELMYMGVVERRLVCVNTQVEKSLALLNALLTDLQEF